MRTALTRIDWKTEYGYAIQLGVEGAVQILNGIADWLDENRRQETLLIDNFEKQGSSVLSGLKAQVGTHYHVPPTLNGRVRMYATNPFHQSEKNTFPIHFLSVPTTSRFGLDWVIDKVVPGTVIFGDAEACADVLEAAKLTGEPLYYCGGMLAVRAA